MDIFQAFLSVKDEKELKAFLNDLLTEQEITELSRRFEAAVMLSESKSYIEIEELTGLSSTTIARVSKSLNSPLAGYKTIISRLK
jgi:TrpR-related protein YerC/YecD